MRSDEKDVTPAVEKESGPLLYGERATKIEEEEKWKKNSNVEPLISPRPRKESTIFVAVPFLQAGADQPHIIDKEQPNGTGVGCAESEPAYRSVEPSEEDGLPKGAGDVEKVMAELKRPFNHSQRVNDRARPKDKDDAQAGSDVKKRRPMLPGKAGARVIGQKIQRYSLNDAGQGELDVYNYRI